MNTTEKWIQLVLQQGPVGTMFAGGAAALSRGLLPVFELREATFGAVLLLVGASIELFIWVFKHRAAERTVERARTDLESVIARVKAAEDRLKATSEKEPFATTGLMTPPLQTPGPDRQPGSGLAPLN